MYSYSGLIVHTNREWTTCKNMSELEKYYTEWKMPGTKSYILYDPIYMKISNRQYQIF